MRRGGAIPGNTFREIIRHAFQIKLSSEWRPSYQNLFKLYKSRFLFSLILAIANYWPMRRFRVVSPSEKCSIFLFLFFFSFFALYRLKQLALTREHTIFIHLIEYYLLASLLVRIDLFYCIDSQKVRAARRCNAQRNVIGIESALRASSLNYARVWR